MSIAKWLLAKKLGGGSPFPPVIKRVTGNPIELTDAADAPMVKCISAITGSQDLHGYNKPWVGGVGKNKLKIIATTQTINGVTVTVNSDGTISCSGNASATIDIYIAGGQIFPAGSYILSGCPTGGGNSTYKLDVPDASYATDSGSGVTFTVDRIRAYAVRLVIYSGNGDGLEFYPMLRLASVTDSTFTPYSNICPITAYTEGEIEVRGKNLFDKSAKDTSSGFVNGRYLMQNGGEMIPTGGSWYVSEYIKVSPSTRYTLSGLSSSDSNAPSICFYGNATVDSYKAGLAYTNRPTISFTTGSNVNYVRISVGPLSTIEDAIQLEKGDSATAYESFGTTHTATFSQSIYQGNADFVGGKATATWGYIASYNGETLPGEWISSMDEYAPGTTPTTGAQVAYELASPTTETITPTNLPIKSLFGYNHIESSTGDMTIDYITDAYQEFVNTVESALPNTRKGGTTAMDIFRSLEVNDEEEPKEVEEVKEETKSEEKR